MREPHRLRADVFQVLASLSGLDPSVIEVTVSHDGVVFLTGSVSSPKEKRIVETVVNRVVGVTEVWSVLEATSTPEEIPDAASLMEAALEALEASFSGTPPLGEVALEHPAHPSG